MADWRARARPLLGRAAALAAALAALAGCGGQSEHERVSAVAGTYARAFVTGDGATVCSLMTASLRREFTAIGGVPKPSGCAKLATFSRGAIGDAAAIRPVVTAVRIDGSRARATIRTGLGVALLPLARERGRWRVNGPVRYLSRVWLEADYRIRNDAGMSASSIAGIVARRARGFIGTPSEARAIGADEVRVAAAEPARLADLGLVTRRGDGRLAFYDWEGNALTPAGRPVADQLRHRDGSALLISQGSGSEPPGAVGGMRLGDALELAGAKRPATGGVRTSRGSGAGATPRWIVVAGRGSPAAAPAGAMYFVLQDRPALTRADITDASANVDPRGDPAIDLHFTAHGADAFRRLTEVLARRGAALSTPELRFNQHVAAVLDGQLLSVVYVDFRVYPNGISTPNGVDLTGGFTTGAARQFAAEITAPPLPADLERVRSTTFVRRGG